MGNLSIENCVHSDYQTICGDEKIAVALSRLRSAELPALVVEDADGKYVGILARRWLRRSKLDSTEVKVVKFVFKAPSVQVTDSISEAARLMVESQSPALPVHAGVKLRGLISIDDVLRTAASGNWGGTSVAQTMTENPLTARPNDPISRVLNLFNSSGVSHAPVMENSQLLGIVSIDDIMDVVYRGRQRQKGRFGGDKNHGGYGERKGEKSALIHMPVKELMSSPVITVKPNATFRNAVKKLLDHDISSLIVMDDNTMVGILTKRDLLQPVAQSEMIQRKIRVQFSVKPGIRMTDDEVSAMQSSLDSFTRRYEDVVGIGILFVYLKRYGSVSRGDQLIQCRIQFRTSHTQHYSSAEAWSVVEAYSLALDRLERGIIEHKDTKLDEEYSARQIKRLLQSEEL